MILGFFALLHLTRTVGLVLLIILVQVQCCARAGVRELGEAEGGGHCD
jgi:hypothetical protein